MTISTKIQQRLKKVKLKPRKKQRTRAHTIADLSVNHVERYVLLCGYSVERVEYDYGTDLVIFTYNEAGEIENGQIFVQLKATDSLKVLADRETVAFPIERSDLELWLKEPMPYIFVVYDAQQDLAYWMYIQAYFESQQEFNLSQVDKTVTVHLKKENILTQKAIRKFVQYKNNVLSQLEGVIRHNV